MLFCFAFDYCLLCGITYIYEKYIVLGSWNQGSNNLYWLSLLIKFASFSYLFFVNDKLRIPIIII